MPSFPPPWFHSLWAHPSVPQSPHRRTGVAETFRTGFPHLGCFRVSCMQSHGQSHAPFLWLNILVYKCPIYSTICRLLDLWVAFTLGFSSTSPHFFISSFVLFIMTFCCCCCCCKKAKYLAATSVGRKAVLWSMPSGRKGLVREVPCVAMGAAGQGSLLHSGR